MPMEVLQKGEIVQRLNVAYKKTKEFLERGPISRDLHPGSDIAQRWPLITAAYSGLEQTLKFLIANEKSYTIKELIDHSIGKKFPFRTHDLAVLFCCLEESKKSDVRDYFGQFQSLHSYIKVECLDDFLKEVSGLDGKGYERWRYTLIEVEEPLPHNSAEALVAIWGVCLEIARKCVFDNQRVRMLNQKLSWTLWQQLQNQMNAVSLKRQIAGEPFQNLKIEARDRLFQDRCSLDVFAEILWHFDQYDSHGLMNVSDQLSEAVYRWIAHVLNCKSKAGMTSLRLFIERAQGRTPEGESIRWNPETNRFEDVPWSLEYLSQNELDQNATNIKTAIVESQLRNLKITAKNCEYEIRENCSFLSSGKSDTHAWYRRLEVSEEKKTIITIWQKKKDGDWHFYFVEECKKEEMSQQVQNWINSNRLYEQIGEFKLVE